MHTSLSHRARIALLALGLSGCGDAGTGNARVHFNAQVGGIAEGGSNTVTNDQGWAVTLTEARVAFGPLYLNTITPLEARRGPLERLSDFVISPAWAHGETHLASGRIAAQVTAQVVIDARAPTLVSIPGGGDGINLDVESAEVWYYNSTAEGMNGAAIRVRGEATRAGVTVPFRGALVIDAGITGPQLTLDQARRVRGIPAALTVRDGGTLTVRISTQRWFDGADFSELAAQRSEGSADPVTFGLSDNVGRAFLNNVRRARDVFAVQFTD
ncbi:MAG: hypothetical protein JNK72_26475 [Myxococcales bacterium]|nr:hypothetical protein [Myxococcales bacterium]